VGVKQVQLRLIASLLLTTCLALPLSAMAEIRTGEPQALRDLHYGEALFYLYQQEYFPAIVRLLAARKQGLMKAYADEPELLLGGLYLAYGMPNTAESLFNRVLRKTATTDIQNRAWLQLGKSRHRKGETQAAKSALNKISNHQPAEAEDEKRQLLGLIDLQQNNPQQALHSLSNISSNSEWALYGQYNQAIALLRSDQQAKALEILEIIGDGIAEQDNEETKAIRDRANLTRGYLLLETQQPEPAIRALQKVRLKGSASNQALLGLGWASLQLDNKELALAPWQLLTKRNPSDPSVLEAKLAIPYVLALLEAEQQSLEAYQDAISTYDKSLQSVNQIIQHITQGGFPDNLIDNDKPSENDNSNDPLRALLPFLLSGNRFQERLQDYQDLLALESNLQQWQQKTDSYHTMLSNQKQAYQQKLPRVDAHLKGDKLLQLTKQGEQLQKLYEQAASPDEPPFLLASGKEKKLIARLEHIDRLIKESRNPEQFQAQKEIAQLMEGILTWNTVTEHPERLWSLKKQISSLQQNIESARHREAELASAQQQAEVRFRTFGQRIEQLEAKIPELLNRVVQLRKAEAKLLQEMALTRLEQRKTLINNYLIQARFGVANLLDISTERGKIKQ
jgi:TolA-binding protein